MRVPSLLAVVLVLGACGASTGAPDASPGDAGATPIEGTDAGMTDGGEDGGAEVPDAGVEFDGGLSCPAWVGDVQRGTAADDELLGLLALPDGLVAVGYEGGVYGVDSIDPSGNSRAVVLRFDLAGHLLWERSLDSPGTDVAEAVAVEPDGSLLVAGRTTGALGPGPNAGQFDAFLARFGPAGEQGPVLQFGDEGPQHPRRVALDGLGGAWMAGYDDIYIPSNFVERWENPWVAHLGLGATPTVTEWNFARTNIADRVNALVATAEGGAVMGGVVQGGPSGGPFLVRLEADGGVRWRTRLSTSGFDSVQGLAAGPDGGLHVAVGFTAGPGTQATLVELNAEGTEVAWKASVPSPLTFPLDVATGPGVVWMSGEMVRGPDGGAGVLPDGGQELQVDAFVARFDLADQRLGRLVVLGGPKDDAASAVAVDRCGRAFVAGFTSGPTAGPHLGNRDGFLSLVR